MLFALTNKTWLHPTNYLSLIGVVIALVVVGLLLFRLRFARKSRLRLSSRVVMFALRLIIVGALALSLVDWKQNKIVTQPAELVVVFDRSKSSGHVDSASSIDPEQIRKMGLGGPTRINSSKFVFLQDQLNRISWLRRRYQVRFAAIGETVEHFSGSTSQKIENWIRSKQAVEEKSRIGDGLEEVVRYQAGRSTAAIICFTDGINTHGQPIEQVTRYAKVNGIPLYFVGLGETVPPIDLSVNDLKYTRKIFVDDIVQINSRLNAVNLEDEKVIVRLIDIASNKILDSTEVKIDKRYFETNVQLSTIGATPGVQEFRVEAVPHEKEAVVENNVAIARVDVRDEVIRVLMLQNYPSNEFRFLKGLLSRQRTSDGAKKTFEVRTLMQLSEPRHPETDDYELEVFPEKMEELTEYDVIIIGDVERGDSYSRAHLNDAQLKMIRDFVVKESGRLILIGGPKFLPTSFSDSPLAELLPFVGNRDQPWQVTDRYDSARIKPTEFASAFPPFVFSVDEATNIEIFNSLPPVNWWQQLPSLKLGTIVLADLLPVDSTSTDRFPLITFQVVSSGRVVYHATDEIYKWRMLNGEKFYGRYWLQLIRFLCRQNLDANGDGSISVDKDVYIEDETVEVKVELPGSLVSAGDVAVLQKSIELTLYRENQPVRNITIQAESRLDGAFVGQIQGLTPGQYQLQLNEAVGAAIDQGVRFQVVASDVETKQLVLQESLLKRVAESTGGGYFHISNVGQMWDRLPTGDATVVERMPPRTAWVDPILGLGYALIIIVLMTSEWIIRKRNGLV